MNKKIAMLALAAALCAGGFFGYKQYQRSEFVTSITPMIKNASIRVINTTKFETDGSRITFGELFERTAEDTKEIEKRSVEVQSIATSNVLAISTPSVAYLEACQEYSRAISMKYRKQLAYTSSIESATEALEEAKSASSYGRDFAKRRLDQSKAKMDEADQEFKGALKSLIAASKQLKDAREKLAGIVEPDALISSAMLDPVIKGNAESLAAINKS